MNFFLIMNPGSGGAKSREKMNKLLDVLANKGIDFEYRLTNTTCAADSPGVETAIYVKNTQRKSINYTWKTI